MGKLTLSILMMMFFISSLCAQSVSLVEGKTYEGNLNGIATLKLDFMSGGEAVFTMSVFGDSEATKCTYEQVDSKIIVHAKNGDMTFTQNETGDISTKIKNDIIRLVCQTPETSDNQISDVAGHTFSGNFGGSKKLTLSFIENGTVEVSVIDDQQKQTEVWPYKQEGNQIVLIEPMGRQITLTLSSNNQLKGMFTIINVSLLLVK